MGTKTTVYNVFFNDGRDGSSDQYIGTASTEAEAQTICDRYPDYGAWDPYYQIVPVTSGETPEGDIDSVNELAAIIREVDGEHKKGAAALAEAILAHPDSLWGRPSPSPVDGDVEELVKSLLTKAEVEGALDRPNTAALLIRAAKMLECLNSPPTDHVYLTHAEIYNLFNDNTKEYMRMYANEAQGFAHAIIAANQSRRFARI